MKAVLFDIGGVVVHDKGLKQSVQDVFANIDPDRLWADLNDAVLPACRGEDTLANCWRNLALTYNLEVPDSQLESLWIDDYRAGIEIDSAVLQIIGELKDSYVIGVISNTVEEHARILDDLGAYRPFQRPNMVLSHEVGMTKDNSRIYSVALERIKLPASEVVFVDDMPRYVEAARQAGLHALQFSNAKQLKEDLLDLGLKFREDG